MNHKSLVSTLAISMWAHWRRHSIMHGRDWRLVLGSHYTNSYNFPRRPWPYTETKFAKIYVALHCRVDRQLVDRCKVCFSYVTLSYVVFQKKLLDYRSMSDLLIFSLKMLAQLKAPISSKMPTTSLPENTSVETMYQVTYSRCFTATFFLLHCCASGESLRHLRQNNTRTCPFWWHLVILLRSNCNLKSFPLQHHRHYNPFPV